MRSDLVDLVSLQCVLFANFFDFFIAQHATTLSNFVLITTLWLASRVGVFAVILFDFEGGSTSAVLGEVIGASIAVV